VGIFFENGEVVKKVPSADLEEYLIAQVEKKVAMMQAAGVTEGARSQNRVDLPMAPASAVFLENK
jgi:hypothetical protein